MLNSMIVETAVLGSADEILIRGKSMIQGRTVLPPGLIVGALLDTRMTQDKSSWKLS
jgi:hypothetical protein